jgi:prepilin-type processing-associated H-X9-DG protein
MLGMLFILAIKTLAGGQLQSQAAACLGNLRRLSLAWLLYADDNASRLVGNLDGAGVQTLSNSNKTWVLGWLDYNGGLPVAANTNTLYLTRYSPLAPYTGRSAEVFKCPSDDSLSRGRTGEPRVRSYSMNGYTGPGGLTWTPGYRRYTNQQDIIDPTPARAFVFVDERLDSINDGTLFVDMAGYDPRQPGSWTIIDYPAMYHDRSSNFSFADGHVEAKRWTDRRTTPAERPGVQLVLANLSANNPDVLWVQERASRKVSSQ